MRCPASGGMPAGWERAPSQTKAQRTARSNLLLPEPPAQAPPETCSCAKVARKRTVPVLLPAPSTPIDTDLIETFLRGSYRSSAPRSLHSTP